MSDRKTHPVDPSKVKVGDLMAFTYYTKITDTDKNGLRLQAEDLVFGMGKIVIDGKELIASSASADQYAEEEKVSKTTVAKMLVTSHNRPFTVCFVKDDGTERTLRGRFLGQDELMGRSIVEDLDVKDKHKIREVNHRTLKWLIVDCVKYTVK